jgi:hypothetical protein
MQHQEIKVTSKSALRQELAKLTAHRIYGNMPKTVLVGHNKRIERVVPKSEVFDFEYARFNTDWQVMLTEMAESMPRARVEPPAFKVKTKFILDPDSRNCTLFETVRHQAYAVVRGCQSSVELYLF